MREQRAVQNRNSVVEEPHLLSALFRQLLKLRRSPQCVCHDDYKDTTRDREVHRDKMDR